MRQSLSRRGAVLAAALTIVIAGAAPWHAARAADAQVAIQDFKFAPASVTVRAGTRVVWVNRDGAPHIVKSATPGTAFQSQPLRSGDSYAHVFQKPGTYNYVCGYHGYMKGTVVVQ